jgi:ankyrin repeat protein
VPNKYEPKKHDFVALFQREQLHSASQRGDIAEVDRLLAADYPVNRFDSIGKTPLHYAAAAEHLEIVDRLISAGANVNAHDERQIGNTPLSDIAGSCTFAMARKLIAAGADPTIPGSMQLTAIDRAEVRKDADAKKIQMMLRDRSGKRP